MDLPYKKVANGCSYHYKKIHTFPIKPFFASKITNSNSYSCFAIISCVFLLIIMTPLAKAIRNQRNLESQKCPDGTFQNCEHYCKAGGVENNRIDNYCECLPGYILGENGNCHLSFSDKNKFLLASTLIDNEITMFKLNETNVENDNSFTFNQTSDKEVSLDDLKAITFKLNKFHRFSDFATELDVDRRETNLYWYDESDKEIHVGPFAHLINQGAGGSSDLEAPTINMTRIVRQLNDFTANISTLYVDSYGKNIYYCNKYTNLISVLSTDGNFQKILIQRDNPIITMAINEKLGIIVWAEEKKEDKVSEYHEDIMIADADGLNVRSLASVMSIYGPIKSIKIYEKDRQIYWLAKEGIKYINIEDPKTTYSYMETVPSKFIPFDFVIDEHHIFWSIFPDENYDSIFVAPFPTKGFPAQHIVMSGEYMFYDKLKIGQLDIDERLSPDAKQFYLDTKMICQECQQLCIPMGVEDTSINIKPKRQCDCGEGYKLDADKKSCYTMKPKDGFIIVADGQLQDIFVINKEKSEFFERLPIEVSERPVTVEYDDLTGIAIWCDIGQSNLQYLSILDYVNLQPEIGDDNENEDSNRITFNPKKLVKPNVLRQQRTNQSLTDGMAIDPIRRLLFFTDVGRDRIGVYDIEGAYEKTIHRNLNKPRSIVIDRPNGYIYWSEWGYPAKISGSTIAGTELRIIEDNSNFVGYPNGLVLDSSKQMLYWIDARKNEIFKHDLQKRLTHRFTKVPSHPFGLALSSDASTLYWSNWKTDTVQKMTIQEGPNYLNISDVTSPNFGRLLDLDIHEQGAWLKIMKEIRSIDRFDEKNEFIDGCFRDDSNSKLGDELWMNNGGCSQICFPMPGKTRVCDCRDGEILDADGITCKINGIPSPRNFARKDMNKYLAKNLARNPVKTYLESTGGIEMIECNETDLLTPDNAYIKNVNVYKEDETLQKDGSYKKIHLEHSCKDGYQKIGGDSDRYCVIPANYSGVIWQGQNINCQVITCPIIKPSPYVETIICTSNRIHAYCAFKCKDGHDKKQGSFLQICEEDGKWSGTQLECEGPKQSSQAVVPIVVSTPAPTVPGKCAMPDLEKSQIIVSHPDCKDKQFIDSGTKCSFVCKTDSTEPYDYVKYVRLSGSEPGEEVECLDGHWERQLLVCEMEIMCPDPFYPKSVTAGYENVSCSAGNELGSECQMKCVSQQPNLISGSLARVCESKLSKQKLIDIVRQADDKPNVLKPYWSNQPPICSRCNVGDWHYSKGEGLELQCESVEDNSNGTLYEHLKEIWKGNMELAKDTDSICTAICKPNSHYNVFASQLSSTVNIYHNIPIITCQLGNIIQNNSNVLIEDETDGGATNDTGDTNYKWFQYLKKNTAHSETKKLSPDGMPYCGAIVLPDQIVYNFAIRLHGIDRKAARSIEDSNVVKCKSLETEIQKWIYNDLLDIPDSVIANGCSYLTIFGKHESTSTCPWEIEFDLCPSNETQDFPLKSQVDVDFNIPIQFTIINKMRVANKTDQTTRDDPFFKLALSYWQTAMRYNLLNLINYLPHKMIENDGLKYKLIPELPSSSSSEVNSSNHMNLKCFHGSISLANGTLCVECPPGTKVGNADECVLCEIGSYQPSAGKLDCETCPKDFTTKFRGAIDKSSCHSRMVKGRRRKTTVMVLFASFIILLIILAVAVYFLFRDKGFGLRNGAHALYPISSIFQNNRDDASEMARVPYGSFA